MEGAFVAGAVAQVEGQAFFVDGTVFAEAAALETFGAAAQPVVLCHAIDQDALGFGIGAMLVVEIGEQDAVGFAVFAREDEEKAVGVAEAVAGVIAGRGGFAFFCSGTRRMLGVGPVGGDLRFGRHGFENAPSCASLDRDVRGGAVGVGEAVDTDEDVIFCVAVTEALLKMHVGIRRSASSTSGRATRRARHRDQWIEADYEDQSKSPLRQFKAGRTARTADSGAAERHERDVPYFKRADRQRPAAEDHINGCLRNPRACQWG